MQKIEELAFVSVGRGCAFAAFAIAIFMVALSADLPSSFRAGGILGLIVCCFLMLRAARAPGNPYQRTELWLMLSPAERPPAALAQSLVGKVLRNTYMHFAAQFALGSAALLCGSILLGALPL